MSMSHKLKSYDIIYSLHLLVKNRFLKTPFLSLTTLNLSYFYFVNIMPIDCRKNSLDESLFKFSIPSSLESVRVRALSDTIQKQLCDNV